MHRKAWLHISSPGPDMSLTFLITLNDPDLDPQLPSPQKYQCRAAHEDNTFQPFSSIYHPWTSNYWFFDQEKHISPYLVPTSHNPADTSHIYKGKETWLCMHSMALCQRKLPKQLQWFGFLMDSGKAQHSVFRVPEKTNLKWPQVLKFKYEIQILLLTLHSSCGVWELRS